MKNMHKSKLDKTMAYQGSGNKAIVMGMLERGGKVKAKVIATRKKHHMSPIMTASVEAGAHIITDEMTTYASLETSYHREIINLACEYVNGHIHTNGIENFWALLKRGLAGTYISVEPIHLDAYVAEQVFRYNHREDCNDAGRFIQVMSQITGKRLTYAELTQRQSLN